MKPVLFIVSQGDEQLTSQAGLGLIGALLGRTTLRERLDQVQIPTRPTPEIRHSEVVAAMTGLVALGKPDFEAVETFRADPFFRSALGLEQVPSAATLRQRLNGLAGWVETIIREESAALVARHAPALTPCYEKADQRYGPWVALDVDVCPFDNSDSHKEGVSWTYQQVDGYAPIFAYLGEEGYLLNCQLRPGSQHRQQEARPFLQQTLKLVRRVTPAKLLVRMDAAHDDIDNVRLLEATPKVD
ncbi:MAG: IS1380 family transposase [Candidatus Latescibacteria bacterium]|nr:IS1380 family transposase [Candidatus Latescibacterota bacterium]